MAQKHIAKTTEEDTAVAPTAPNGRYQQGWRTGKPVEDPEKTKSWGYVTAKPSEYLVVIKNGRIDMRLSGQGMRVWKWPWNAVAIVPTSIQQIDFVADQITRERVGVSVSGVAVYRIAQPEIAFRVLNFSYGESAKEKLAATLREMFIGASRRLIANLGLEQCLANRKEAIAAFLMQEIAPVVSGTGRPDDTTDQGWGVVIDTIEIQDVKILSQQVFTHLQAPYRAELAKRAEMAELEQKRAVAELRALADKQTQEAALVAQRETRILRAQAEATAAESEAAEALRAEQAKAQVQADELGRKEALARKRLAVEEGIALRQAESTAAVELHKLKLKQEHDLGVYKLQEHKRIAAAQAELAALASEAELCERAHLVELRKAEQNLSRKALVQQAESSLQQQKAEAERELKRIAVESQRLEHEAEAAHQRNLAEIEVLLNQGRVLRDLVTQGLPQIAGAFKQNFGSIHYTQLGQGPDGGPFAMIGTAMAQVLAIAKSFGLDPTRLGEPAAPPTPAPTPKPPVPPASDLQS